MSSELSSKSLMQGVLCALVRRRYVFLATFFVIATIVVLGVLDRRDTFVSEAKLFVRIGRESVALDPTATTGQTSSLSASRETEINSILELFLTRAVVAQVVDSIGPEKILATQGRVEWIDRAKQWTRDVKQAVKHQLAGVVGQRSAEGGVGEQLLLREAAIDQLMGNISIDAPKMSRVVIVTSKAQSPELAQEIVANYVRVCVDEHVRLNRTEGSLEFFQEQCELLRTQWVAKRQQLNQLKNERGIGTIESQFAMLDQQRADVELARLHNSSELAATQAKCDAVQATLSQLEPTVLLQSVAGVEDAGTEGMRQLLYGLEIQEGELAAKYHEDHPLMVAIRRQLEEARTIHAAEQDSQTQSTHGLNPTWQQLHTEHMQAKALLASLAATGSVLDEQRETILAHTRDLNIGALQYENLQRDIEQLAAGYTTYVESLELSRIDNALEQQRISNVNVAQAATFAPMPIGLSRSVMAGLGLCLALVCGAGMVLFVEYLLKPAPLPQREQRVRLDTPRRCAAVSPAMSHGEDPPLLETETDEGLELESAGGEGVASSRSPR